MAIFRKSLYLRHLVMCFRESRLLLELVKTMLPSDDFLSEEDIADIEQARAEFARGEFVRHEDISWK